MYLACGLVGLGVAGLVRLAIRPLPRLAPGAAALAVAIVVLAAAPGFDLLRRMWTPQLEFELFREGLRGVDRRCTVVTLARTRDAGFAPYEYLVAGEMLDIADFLDAPTGDCVIYYRTGNCYATSLDVVPRDTGVHPACRAIEERFRLDPIVERAVPALPYRGETYGRDPLPLGFYRLQTGAGNGR
jgi:hypothetical protein